MGAGFARYANLPARTPRLILMERKQSSVSVVVVIVVIQPISLPHSAWYLPHCLEQASQSYLLIKPVDFLLEMWHVRKINWWKLMFT